MGSCKHCGQKAGFLRRSHKECDNAHRAGRQRMVALVADAAGRSHFSEAALLDDLESIAAGSYIDEDGIRAVIAEGWHQAVKEGLADGILTQDEEARLRDFRDRLTIEEQDEASRDTAAQLGRAARDRLMLDARLVALAITGGSQHLDELATAAAESELSAT